MSEPQVLLSGIVGSTAYGLAHEGSDVDRLGMYAAPTAALHGLHRPRESHVTTNPDRTLHEAGKFCQLTLGCNPTVMELLWLPDDLYETCTPLGDELIGIRQAFLSAKRVRDAYLGYASQQFRRLLNRGDGSFSADTRKRTAKHARHLKRLCHQGYGLYSNGRLEIRVDDPLSYHDFGEQVAKDPTAAGPLLAGFEDAFSETRSPLPDYPDEDAVEAWLRRVRAVHLDPAPAPGQRRRAVVCDLDGTLAIIGDRDPYAAEECGLDTVNQPVARILVWARNHGYAVILVSGRGYDPRHQLATERWLTWNRIGYDELHMRQVGDDTKDFELKSRIYTQHIHPRYDVELWLDDRQSVVDAIRALGVTVLQVDDRI